jgi:hypothetical protein
MYNAFKAWIVIMKLDDEKPPKAETVKSALGGFMIYLTFTKSSLLSL